MDVVHRKHLAMNMMVIVIMIMNALVIWCADTTIVRGVTMMIAARDRHVNTLLLSNFVSL